jgi:hypothetical protein
MEMTMDDKKPDPRTIAEEAVAKEKAEMAPEDAVRQVAIPAGTQAGIAARTAEAVGERVGDAYADATTDEAQERSRKVVRKAATQAGSQASGAAQQPFMTVVAAFAVGYVAALLIHRRR